MEEVTEEKKITAKTISKVAKVVSAVGIVACHVCKWLGWIQADSMEICVMWVFVYGVAAGTIDANIIIDKFRKPE